MGKAACFFQETHLISTSQSDLTCNVTMLRWWAADNLDKLYRRTVDGLMEQDIFRLRLLLVDLKANLHFQCLLKLALELV